MPNIGPLELFILLALFAPVGVVVWLAVRDRKRATPAGTGEVPATTGRHAPPGWYVDPADPTLQRYWDGHAWTLHTAAPRT